MSFVKTKEDRIRVIADKTDMLQRVSNAWTHVNRHHNIDDVAYLERIFLEKSVNSAFTDTLPIDQVLSEMLYYKAHDIATWLETAEMGEKKGFYVSFDEDDFGPIGTGLIRDYHTGLIKEYSTQDICMVLRKNAGDPGFTLVTAYPNMDSPTVEPTQRNLKDTVMQTQTFKEASDVKKAYLLYTTSWKSSLSISYKAGLTKADDALYLYIPTGQPNATDVIKMKAHTTMLKTMLEDPETNSPRCIETVYHNIRDRTQPEHRGKQGVLLENPAIRTEFAKNHPQADKEIAYLQQHIRQFEQERYLRYQHRRAMADGIVQQSTASTCDYSL